MRAALLAEGTSDRALLPILRWVISEAAPARVTQLDWVDTSRLPTGKSLEDRIHASLRVYPCDLIFIHRDADKQEPELRYVEIGRAAGDQPHVAVVPVRMTEAWLLIDEPAIRRASGRVSGREPLGLPDLARLESTPDPKGTLHEALRRAHGGTGRRASQFHPPAAVGRLADLVSDWTPLRRLSAFQRLEADTRAAVEAWSRSQPPHD